MGETIYQEYQMRGVHISCATDKNCSRGDLLICTAYPEDRGRDFDPFSRGYRFKECNMEEFGHLGREKRNSWEISIALISLKSKD